MASKLPKSLQILAAAPLRLQCRRLSDRERTTLFETRSTESLLFYPAQMIQHEGILISCKIIGECSYHQPSIII